MVFLLIKKIIKSIEHSKSVQSCTVSKPLRGHVYIDLLQNEEKFKHACRTSYVCSCSILARLVTIK